MTDLLLRYLPFAVLFGALYFMIGRKRTRGEGWGFVLALIAALPLCDGGFLLLREIGRWDDARVTTAVVVERFSSTGADGTRTIGGSRFSRPSHLSPPYFRTSEGFLFHDVIARMLLTGSKNAWVIQYRYSCPAANACWRLEGVPYELWSALNVGQTVNLRAAKGQRDPGRLDQNPMWNTALAKLGIGVVLGLVGVAASGRLRLRRRKLVTVPAIITAVKPVSNGGSGHWRVEFAYLTDSGDAFESADIVYAPGLQQGDTCSAVYPADSPALATLQTS